MFSCSSQCHVPHKVPQFFSLESSLIFSSLAVSFFLDLKKDTNCFPTNASTSAVNNHDLLGLSRISPWRCTERSRGSCLPWGKRIDFSPCSLHTSMAHSHGRTIWGQALFNSGDTCGSIRDAPVSAGCPSHRPAAPGAEQNPCAALYPAEQRVHTVLVGLGMAAPGKKWQHLPVAGVFLSLLLYSPLQVGAKGSPGLLLTAGGSWSNETPQGSHQGVQGAPREK